MIVASVVLVSLYSCLVLADVPERCSITPTIVPCSGDGNGLKYFFNTTTNSCSTASQWPTKMCLASGQDGFDDYYSCFHTCICSIPPPESMCPEVTDAVLGKTNSPRWFFNQENGVCEAFTNYGCMGDSSYYRSNNDFYTESDCKQQCVCTKPVDAGTGDLDIEAYAFNVNEKKCNRFSYKGQGGNANRFATNEECLEKCLCGLEVQDGNGRMSCLAYIPSWAYNKKEGACKSFIYGGCAGNSNRFGSQEECLEACGN